LHRWLRNYILVHREWRIIGIMQIKWVKTRTLKRMMRLVGTHTSRFAGLINYLTRNFALAATYMHAPQDSMGEGRRLPTESCGTRRRVGTIRLSAAVYQGYWTICHTLHSYATPNELLFLNDEVLSRSAPYSLAPCIFWRVMPIILEISTRWINCIVCCILTTR